MIKRPWTAAIFGITMLTVGPSWASQWPASVVGVWASVTGSTSARLAVATQDHGAPCAGIGGSITDAGATGADRIEGFYCPETGRIVLARHVGTAKTVSGVYSGNLAADGATQTIGGTFAQDLRQPGTLLGEVGFHAQK